MIRGLEKTNNYKKFILLTLTVCSCFIFNSKAFAQDNVLQAIEIDGVKDSYNIIFKSDDVAEVQKTIQAPNKMVINLKGIRASKTINTIYNNTSSVDNVVVEPINDENVKISIQADNVNNANVQFDTLKTPLGVLDKQVSSREEKQLELNKPMSSYTPVYDELEGEDDSSGISLNSVMSSSAAKYAKKALKNDKLSMLIGIGLFAIMLLGGMKNIKSKDNDIKVGLSQSLKERELDLYRATQQSPLIQQSLGIPQQQQIAKVQINAPAAGANYGLKAYQNNARSPYVSSEIQRPRPQVAPQAPVAPPVQNYENIQRQMAQRTAQRPTQNMATSTIARPQAPAQTKTTNIDSIKFLESMTKIYEKNGRSDLAQGLKSNMKKANINIA